MKNLDQWDSKMQCKHTANKSNIMYLVSCPFIHRTLKTNIHF